MYMSWTRTNLHAVEIWNVCAIFFWLPAVFRIFTIQFDNSQRSKDQARNLQHHLRLTELCHLRRITLLIISALSMISFDPLCSLISQSWMAIVLDIWIWFSSVRWLKSNLCYSWWRTRGSLPILLTLSISRYTIGPRSFRGLNGR